MKQDKRAARAARAYAVLERYVDEYDHGLDLKVMEDYQAATADLVADLLHAGADQPFDFDPEDAIASGLMHFTDEQGGED